MCDYIRIEGANRNGTLGERQGGLPSSIIEIAEWNFSRDIYRRMLIALRPEAIQERFLEWSAACVETDTDGFPQLIRIDGKACRGVHDHSKGLGPLHNVSAWVSEQGITLGQIATDEKSNEMTVIPKLLG